MLRRTTFITAIAVVLGFLLNSRSFLHEQDLRMIFGLAVFFAVVFTGVIWRSSRQTSRFLDEAYSSFEITADGQTWTKRQKNTPEVTLTQTEVVRVEEFVGKGFRICTSERNRNIWVPCELDGYEQLKSEVLALPGVTLTSRSAAWLRTYLALGAGLALLAVSVLASDKKVAAASSLVLSAWFLTTAVRNYRNPNLTTRGRRQFLLVTLVGVGLFVRAVLVWRA